MKPNIRTLSKLELIDAKIKELYEKKRQLISQVVKKYGKGEHTYTLEKETPDGHKFVRYRLVDNLDEFSTGAPMWKSAAFERYGFEAKYLKNEPKENK